MHVIDVWEKQLKFFIQLFKYTAAYQTPSHKWLNW
jgi:hypothetical protein